MCADARTPAGSLMNDSSSMITFITATSAAATLDVLATSESLGYLSSQHSLWLWP